MFLLLHNLTQILTGGWYGLVTVWRAWVISPAACGQRDNGRVDAAPMDYG